MVQAYATEKIRPLSEASQSAAPLSGLLVAGLLALLVAAGIAGLRPPVPAADGAPPAEFSAGRAMAHVRAIAERPRPTGSAAHRQARDYIVRALEGMGLAPEVQQTTAIDADRGAVMRGATVENIFAIIPGREDGPAVCLVSHYDTVPNSPGASDDGAGVAALLETARALRDGPPLRNPVFLLFTDAEEAGLLGARAFVQQHPLARQIGLVINLEARGHSGPAILFETGADNAWAIREAGRALPRPVSNSLAQEVYRRLPNDTDLSVFKRAGLPGLNIAHIGGATHYHNAIDTAAALDPATLQHHGTYALHLARRFGELDLAERPRGEAIYFDLFGRWLISYPQALGTALGFAAMGLYLTLLIFGLRSRRWRVGGLLTGFAALAACLLASAGVAIALWYGVMALHRGAGEFPQGEIYNDTPYLIAFAVLAFAVTGWIYGQARRRANGDSLVAGGLIWVVAPALATAVWLPGASYLFTWPSLAAVAALAAAQRVARRQRGDYLRAGLLLVAAATAIALMAPLAILIWSALPPSLASACIAALVGLAGLPLAYAPWFDGRGTWRPALVAAAGLLSLGAGVLASGFDEARPKPSNLFYVLNADAGRAVWASYDAAPDEWSRQYLQSPSRGPLTDYFPNAYPNFLRSEAPVIAWSAPELTVLEDLRRDGLRTVRVRIDSRRAAPMLMLQGASEGGWRVVQVNDQALDRRLPGRWALNYQGVPREGLTLTLETSGDAPLSLRVTDVSYELPTRDGALPRPSWLMPAKPFADATLISKALAL